LQHGDSICTYFGNTYQQLLNQQSDINEEIRNVVTLINSSATQLAALNSQIRLYEMGGAFANDLRDQRARLLDDLTRYVNIEVKEIEFNKDYAAGLYPAPEDRGKSDKRFFVFVDGNLLVDGTTANLLEIRERTVEDGTTGELVPITSNPEDGFGLYDIFWRATGEKFGMYSKSLQGELKGLIDIRDGNNQNHHRTTSNDVLYNAATGVLTMQINPFADGQRVDLAFNGIISVRDNASGHTREYTYTDYTLAANGDGTYTATLRLLNPTANTALDFDGTRSTTIEIGKTSEYKGIPYYMSRLNTLARTFVHAINTGTRMDGTQIPGMIYGGHLHGFDLDGNNNETLLFTYVNMFEQEEIYDTSGGAANNPFNIYLLNAKNIVVNELLLREPRFMQNSSGGSDHGIDNNELIKSLSKIANDKSLFLEGNLGDFITSMIGELGIDKRQADSFTKSYTELTVHIDNQRLAISSVSLDEESVSLVMYQQQFRAAANLINAIDRIYDTLINRLGNF
jgi:flagellar hook-associated protein 1 FlgK